MPIIALLSLILFLQVPQHAALAQNEFLSTVASKEVLEERIKEAEEKFGAYSRIFHQNLTLLAKLYIENGSCRKGLAPTYDSLAMFHYGEVFIRTRNFEGGIRFFKDQLTKALAQKASFYLVSEIYIELADLHWYINRYPEVELNIRAAVKKLLERGGSLYEALRDMERFYHRRENKKALSTFSDIEHEHHSTPGAPGLHPPDYIARQAQAAEEAGMPEKAEALMLDWISLYEKIGTGEGKDWVENFTYLTKLYSRWNYQKEMEELYPRMQAAVKRFHLQDYDGRHGPIDSSTPALAEAFLLMKKPADGGHLYLNHLRNPYTKKENFRDIWERLAETFRQLKNFEKARYYAQKVLNHDKIAGKNLDATSLMDVYRNLALVEWHDGNLEAAESWFLKNEFIFNQEPAPLDEEEQYFTPAPTFQEVSAPGYVNTDLMTFYAARGENEKALAYARLAAKENERFTSSLLTRGTEETRIFSLSNRGVNDLFAALGSAPDIAEAVLKYKGLALESVLEEKNLLLASAKKKNATAEEILRSIEKKKSALQRLNMTQNPQNDLEIYKLKADILRSELRIRETYIGMNRSLDFAKVRVEDVRRVLRRDEALIEFVSYLHKGQSHYGAVIISSASNPIWIPLNSDINSAVERFKYIVRAPKEATELSALISLHELYNFIWSPIEKELPAGVDKLIISPEGELNFVSFATFVSKDQKFLSEAYKIRYVSTGRDLLREVRRVGNTNIAAFGDPKFEQKRESALLTQASQARSDDLRFLSEMKLSQLPGTRKEVTSLKFKERDWKLKISSYLGEEASEKALRQVHSPKILHIASHGFVLPESADDKEVFLRDPMLRSGIALSGAQNTLHAWAKGIVPPLENDGIVTAGEFSNLDLRGTWLVNLSACDTGSGKSYIGEGVMGLRRGVIQAGAQNLLMTLWPIGDEITVHIMDDFYSEALRAGNAADALAEVQRKWLVAIRDSQTGNRFLSAAKYAGAFIMSSQGPSAE